MQKTSNYGFYDPILLDERFPVTFPLFHQPPDEPHIHNCFEIGYCYQGAGIFLIGNKIFSCYSGDAVFINSQEFHILKNDSPQNSRWKFINLRPQALLTGWVHPDGLKFDMADFAGEHFSNVVHAREHPALTGLTALLIAELEAQEVDYENTTRALLWAIMSKLNRITPRPQTDAAFRNKNEQEMVYPALKHIADHYTEEITIPQLARLCCCSVSSFRRFFLRGIGTLPRDYLNEFRLKNAANQLLQTRKGIYEIAIGCGFGSISNFNRQFQKHFAQSPRDYRASGVQKK